MKPINLRYICPATMRMATSVGDDVTIATGILEKLGVDPSWFRTAKQSVQQREPIQIRRTYNDVTIDVEVVYFIGSNNLHNLAISMKTDHCEHYACLTFFKSTASHTIDVDKMIDDCYRYQILVNKFPSIESLKREIEITCPNVSMQEIGLTRELQLCGRNIQVRYNLIVGSDRLARIVRSIKSTAKTAKAVVKRFGNVESFYQTYLVRIDRQIKQEKELERLEVLTTETLSRIESTGYTDDLFDIDHVEGETIYTKMELTIDQFEAVVKLLQN